MRDPDGKNGIKMGSRFTNTAVPRFDGGGYWQQHLQIVQAIVKSKGWSEGTAALQLFAHLDGEALNVALLMPVEKREKWDILSNGLSEYYNSPGRLAAGSGSECGRAIRIGSQARMLVGSGLSGRVRRFSESRISPDGVAGAPGVFGNGLASSSVHGWCGVEECGDSAEGGEGRWSVGSLGSHILAGNTTITNGTGGSTGGREGSFEEGVESIISHVAGT